MYEPIIKELLIDAMLGTRSALLLVDFAHAESKGTILLVDHFFLLTALL